MVYKDGEDFTTYCDKLYDRHAYKINLKNGKSIVFDSYEMMRVNWFHGKEHCESVEVIDKGGKGF